MIKIREKKHRLERSFYTGDVTVAFTINVKNKIKILNDDFIFKEFEKILFDEIDYSSRIRNKKNVTSPFMGEQTECDHEGCGYEIPVYLFMPDHIHLIIQGKNEKSDVIEVINMFKQRTGFWFYQNSKNIRWQKDYYDHIIRNEKDIGNQVNYILYNPVRKGLVNYWKEYKYKGSTVHNFDEWE